MTNDLKMTAAQVRMLDDLRHGDSLLAAPITLPTGEVIVLTETGLGKIATDGTLAAIETDGRPVALLEANSVAIAVLRGETSDGHEFVQLRSVGGDLEGEAPGLYFPEPHPTFAVGNRARAAWPNQSWGEGEVVEVTDDPSRKRYTVRRDDGTVGHFDSGMIEHA